MVGSIPYYPIVTSFVTLLGLGLLLGVCTTRLHIEGDSTCVIQALRGEFPCPWSIDYLIRDTGIFLSKCRVVNVSHTYREANRTADWIANEGYHYNNNFCWTTSPSRQLDDIFKDGLLGMSLERRAS